MSRDFQDKNGKKSENEDRKQLILFRFEILAQNKFAKQTRISQLKPQLPLISLYPAEKSTRAVEVTYVFLKTKHSIYRK